MADRPANDVLILDGDQRSALAAIRSLGRKGASIAVTASRESSIGVASRFSCHSWPVPGNADRYLSIVAERVREVLSRNPSCVIFPTTDASTIAVYEALASSDARLVAPPRTAYRVASDKAMLSSIASEVGVRVPRTVICHSRQELHRILTTHELPVVVKPARSRFVRGGDILATTVSVLTTRHEAIDFAQNAIWLEAMPALVQEFVSGHGAGVFSLYGAQGPVAWFAHRRIREKPPSGGVSVLCESVPVDERLRSLAERLLNALKWRGLAMVEFRIATDGTPYLMEINARLWGSVQLAVDCGVDFPWLAYQVAMGEPVSPVTDYAIGRRLRWLLGDVDHLWLRWKDPGASLGQKLGAAAKFAGSFADLRARNEVFRWEDPAPAWVEFRNWLRGSG